MERLGLSVTTAVADAARWQPEELADALLLDAPCSATGTIRRHPDVARLKTAEDVGRLASLQRRLLDRAIDMVKPGGLVVYCTCSLQPEEGEEQLSKLLSRRTDVMVEPVIPVDLAYQGAADDAGMAALGELVTDAGDVRATPGHWAKLGGLDGFFVTRLRRTN